MTLYDVLGTTRSASAETLHAAYRERARALHPDLHAHAPTEQRLEADERMRELNAAWRVLSDPARRREYDRSLAPPPPAPPGPDRVPRWEDDDVEYDGPGVARLARMIPIVVLLAVLGFIFVFTAFALDGPNDERATPSSATASDPIAEVGDCVRVRGGHVSEIVACGQPNDGEVRHVIDRVEACPDDTRRIDGSDGSSALCLTID